MGVYRSCGCKQCRHAPSKIKRMHKRAAHRALRRENRLAIQSGRELPKHVSTGYIS